MPTTALKSFPRRAGLLAVLLGGLCLGSVSSPAAAGEKDAAAWLESLGGQVKKTEGVPVEVSFKDSSKLGAAEFQRIGTLASLRKATFYGKAAGINDETLPSLVGLTALEELSTDGVQFTDAGLAPFAKMQSLKSIAMFHPSWGSKNFNGSGFAVLAENPKLERLTVAGSPFDDRGMEAVGKLTQLKEFHSWHTFQTAAGNVHLRKLVNLKKLRFGQRLTNYSDKTHTPSLSDETLLILADMKSLESLTLDETRLSAAAVRKLVPQLPKLKDLSLLNVDMPEADADALAKEFPAVKFKWTPPGENVKAALRRFFGDSPSLAPAPAPKSEKKAG